MRTEAQIEASRANGRRSQGPVTPEGKARSSQNAYRHGLLTATIVLKTEEKEAFGQYLDQHIQHFQPADDVELNLVEEMVGAAWRARRSAGMQTMVFDAEFAAIELSGCLGNDMVDAFNRLAASPALGLFHRYETHYHRIYHRCIQTLLKVQKARPKTPAEPELPNEPKPAAPNEPNPAAEAPSPIPTPAPAPLPDPYSHFDFRYRTPSRQEDSQFNPDVD
jgi:hypothetical protein